MFGYIMADMKALSSEERDRYTAFYCGVCKALGERYDNACCAYLTYDMTFLALLLNAVYGAEEAVGYKRCAPQPLKRHACVQSEAVDYAADLNVILAYYQLMDDWQDDRNHSAKKKAEKLEPFVQIAKNRCPQKYEAVRSALCELSEMERQNELNPDLPANCFGRLLGELFAWREDERTGILRAMGAALGRFTYLLDAVNDLKEDLLKQRYNPLVAQLNTDFEPILTLMMGECTQAFESLNVQKDASILRNVLYAGVWMKQRITKEEKAHADR